MVFWTIVFFAVSLYGVFRGSIFSPSGKKLKEISIKMTEGNKEDENKLAIEALKAGCFPVIIGFTMIIAEVIYLIAALTYDNYKFPTIVAILLIIMSFVFNKNNKQIKDMSADELTIEKAKLIKQKSVTLGSIVKGLLWTVYFGYMFYILVF
jgi:hypothetical protein